MTKTIISVSAPTPKWATWVFRIVFFITTGLSFWVAGTNLVPESIKVEIMLAFKSLDIIVWGLGKSLGVKKDDFTAEN